MNKLDGSKTCPERSRRMELEWLKKKLSNSVKEKRRLIEWEHPELSVRRQCELMGLNRSTLYYQSAQESSSAAT